MTIGFRYIVVLVLFFNVEFCFGQGWYKQLLNKVRPTSMAYGVQTGQLTGAGFQLVKGYACGSKKDDFSKDYFIDFTIGLDQVFRAQKNYERADLMVYGHTLRSQLNLQKTVFHFSKTDVSIGVGIQYGIRESYYAGKRRTNSSMGFRPGVGIEHFFDRKGTGTKPNYLSVFSEAFWYKEIAPEFNDFFLSAGLRLNLFR
jgi:hypothetical protein